MIIYFAIFTEVHRVACVYHLFVIGGLHLVKKLSNQQSTNCKKNKQFARQNCLDNACDHYLKCLYFSHNILWVTKQNPCLFPVQSPSKNEFLKTFGRNRRPIERECDDRRRKRCFLNRIWPISVYLVSRKIRRKAKQTKIDWMNETLFYYEVNTKYLKN